MKYFTLKTIWAYTIFNLFSIHFTSAQSDTNQQKKAPFFSDHSHTSGSFKFGYDFVNYGTLDFGGYYMKSYLYPSRQPRQFAFEYGANFYVHDKRFLLSPKLAFRFKDKLPICYGFDLNVFPSEKWMTVVRPQIGYSLGMAFRLSYGYGIAFNNQDALHTPHSIQLIIYPYQFLPNDM